jgi:hypothetical protein
LEQFVAVDGAHAAAEALQVRSLSGAKSSLGDAKSSLGDAKRSLDDAYLLLGGR